MYTPYNMFYPELPKAQKGIENPPDGKDPVVGDRIQMSDGSIYVYAQKQDGSFGWVPENTTQASSNDAVVDQNPPTIAQNTGTDGKPAIGLIIDANGKPGKIIGYNADGKPNVRLLANDDSYFLKGSQKDYTSDYNDLEAALNDPKVKEALWNEYQKNKTSYTVKGKGSSYKNVKDADELVNRFLKTQKAIMILNSRTSEKEFEDLKLDINKENRSRILTEFNIDDTDLSAFQKSFYDLKDIAENSNTSEEVKTKLDLFNWTGLGPVDPFDSESIVGGKGSGNLSVIDDIFGDNTSRQIATTKQKAPVVIKKDEEQKNIGEKIIPGVPTYGGKIPRVGMFPQDVNNLFGALAAWTGTKKYMPYMPQADLANYDPTFYDPSRALANINEQTNIGTQGLNAYSNPQAYVAGYNQMQGKAAEQAANTLGQYENLNVGVANDAAKYNAEVDTKQALYDAQRTGKFYDQVTIANQQFDNSKNFATDRTIAAYNKAITNRAMANTINYMNPNEYFLDTRSGGIIRFNKDGTPSNLDATYKSDVDRRADQFANVLKMERFKGQDPEKVYRILYPSETSPDNYKNQNQNQNQNLNNMDLYRALLSQFGIAS